MNIIPVILLGISTLTTPVDKELKYDNHIYEAGIKTPILYRKGTDNPTPIITLNGTDKLVLTFDELGNDNDYYQYTFVHCNANWEPSNLVVNEYINGNLFGDVKEFNYSTNTYIQYVHYSLEFPTQDMKPKVSGNYILKVYRNFDDTDIILTRRFMVLDNRATIAATIKGATHPEHRFSKQEVDFTVDYAGYTIPNPFMDVTAVICQNNRWDNAIRNLNPQYVNNNVLTYNFEEGNLFGGGNEFRFFDIRSLRFMSRNVVKKYIEEDQQNVLLMPMESRSFLQYFQYIDYNGKRVTENKDGTNSAVDGDYAIIHFTFTSNHKIPTGEMYVFGELTDWQIKPEFKLEYLSHDKAYYGTAVVKQAHYDFYYVIFDEKEQKVDLSFTEGNFFQTENDYQIYIYHKNQMQGYDELIASEYFNSRTADK